MNRASIRKMEGGAARVETGPVQFGDDWPGVFIRGDNAGCYAHALMEALSGMEDGLVKCQLTGLANILSGAIVAPSRAAEDASASEQPLMIVGVSCQIQAALDSMQSAWYSIRSSDDNPFSNTGAVYDGTCFKARAYSWSDDDQPFNFAWRDVRITWYKYIGRGMAINRQMSDDEVIEMTKECLREILAVTEPAAVLLDAVKD